MKLTKSKLLFMISTFALVLLTCAFVAAQHGGKAEPNRIEFKRGATSTTINGTVRGDEEAEYVLAARQGQKLVIKLTSVPAKSSVFQILGPDNDTLGLEFDANYNYSGVLPTTGDYFISVKRPTKAKGRSRYRLTITVRRAGSRSEISGRLIQKLFFQKQLLFAALPQHIAVSLWLTEQPITQPTA